jgi:hypothetical protein
VVFVALGSSMEEQSMIMMTMDQLVSMTKDQLTTVVDKSLVDKLELTMTMDQLTSMMAAIKEQVMPTATESGN